MAQSELGSLLISRALPRDLFSFRDISDLFFFVSDVPYLGSGARAGVDGIRWP